MKANNVVVRFLDGRLLKGSTEDFRPPVAKFHLAPFDAPEGAAPVCVHLAELKAVFFVRDVVGDRAHVPRNQFVKDQPFMGRKVRVVFADREVIVGWTMGYGEPGPGFFLFPADLQRNTHRLYVVAANATEISLLGP